MSTPRISCGDCGQPFDSIDAVDDHDCPAIDDHHDLDDDDDDGCMGLVVADGSSHPRVTSIEDYRDISAFRQLLVETAIRICHEEDVSETYGGRIRRDVEDLLDHTVPNNRLYPNLSWLVDHGLLRKEPLNDRAKAYLPTRTAVQLVYERQARLTQIVDAIDDSENTPPDAAPNPVGVDH